jgi:hypothetical protein
MVLPSSHLQDSSVPGLSSYYLCILRGIPYEHKRVTLGEWRRKKKGEVFPMAKPPVPITSGMAISGRTIYFGSHANLYELEIPSNP